MMVGEKYNFITKRVKPFDGALSLRDCHWTIQSNLNDAQCTRATIFLSLIKACKILFERLTLITQSLSLIPFIPLSNMI